MSDQEKRELVKELKSIRDDKDFVCGAMSNAGGDKAWEVMLDFIKMARRRGDELSSDTILLLSLDLAEEFKQSKSASTIRKIAVL